MIVVRPLAPPLKPLDNLTVTVLPNESAVKVVTARSAVLITTFPFPVLVMDLEAAAPVMDPPCKVNVLALISRLPLVNVTVPVTVEAVEAAKVTPALLLIVRFLAPVKPVPAFCAEPPLKV